MDITKLKIGESIVIASDEIKLPTLAVGDVILGGKFKNKRMVIQGIEYDDKGQPVLITDKGKYPVFKFRLEKLMKK